MTNSRSQILRSMFASTQEDAQLKGFDDSKKVPSKLTSFFRNHVGHKQGSAADASRKAMRKKSKKSKKKAAKEEKTLQTLFDRFLMSRGYSAEKYTSLESGYHCQPTDLQQASHGCRVSQAARYSDEELLKRLLDSGLSPNPCNRFGESLVHMVCRRGNANILEIMLEAGCSLQVTDDYGRTPLHDACWGAEPNFECILQILQSDRNLIRLVDARGSTPLNYVHREHWPKWVEFLKEHADSIWPPRNLELEGEEYAPALTKLEIHSLPIPDPENALPVDMAEMVSNGRIEPEEVKFLGETDDDDSDSESDSDSEYDSDDSSYFDSDDESEFDEAELAEFCLRAGGAGAIAHNVFN